MQVLGRYDFKQINSEFKSRHKENYFLKRLQFQYVVTYKRAVPG